MGELFAAWSELANMQSTIDDDTSAYEPEGIPSDLREARALAKADFEHACSLLPQFDGREDLIVAGERSLMNEMMCLVREEQLLRKVDMVEGCAEEHEEGAGRCSTTTWVGCGAEVRSRHRGGMAGGVSGFGGADGGIDRVGFGNRGGFGGGREVASEVAEVASEVAEGRASCVAQYGHIARDCPLSMENQQQQPAPGFSAWQGGDAGVAGTGATAACAGTGAECTAAAAPTTGRNQGRRQDLSDDGGKSLPSLFGSSDDERVMVARWALTS